MAILSATTVAVSRTQIAATVYQRRGARSMSRKIASTGTWVPTWSGWERSTWTPLPSCGASMIPAAMSARAQPSPPLARPRASAAAASTSSV